MCNRFNFEVERVYQKNMSLEKKSESHMSIIHYYLKSKAEFIHVDFGYE